MAEGGSKGSGNQSGDKGGQSNGGQSDGTEEVSNKPLIGKNGGKEIHRAHERGSNG